MIKGILLKKSPHMGDKDEIYILSRLDPLKEYEGLGTRTDPMTGKEIFRRSYYSDDLYISTYASDSKDAIDAIWEVFDTLNKGATEYIKSFKKDERTIVIAWPRYEDKFEDATYTTMIEEITRIVAFFIKEFGSDGMVDRYIRDYINMCVANGED